MFVGISSPALSVLTDEDDMHVTAEAADAAVGDNVDIFRSCPYKAKSDRPDKLCVVKIGRKVGDVSH